MRIAFFSPLPPAASGIADYSAALLEELGQLADITPFSGPGAFDPAGFDSVLYQVGNNADHGFVYRTALEHPGVVVLHEANLHHLIAEITIRQGDWDGYLREADYHGGSAALEHARRVHAGRTGPDYDGLPMTRRLLERSRGVIVHSAFVERHVREAGFKGPVARIPHGAWLAEQDGAAWRRKLGLTDRDTLIGIFGHLKPYKRIPESLRAFRRAARDYPGAKLILVGQPHPALPLEPLLESLELEDRVRLIGYTPIPDFQASLAACDIVLNLRYPTVGESSGTLMRALGLGKPAIVSEVGAFCEFPSNVCLKVPVDETEEDYLAEYLALLLREPEMRLWLGSQARQWAERECAWPVVARLYRDFLSEVARGTAHAFAPAQRTEPEPPAPPDPVPVEEATAADPAAVAAEILDWAGAREASIAYARNHLARLEKTIAITPPGGPADRILEMGAYMQITPLLATRLGYGEVRGCYYGQAGQVERHSIVSAGGASFTCDVELFDAERDPFPYPDAYFSTVLCCELVEHLHADPMFMMGEINRILQPGGHLVMTTPNIASLRAISAIVQGYHPGFFPAYIQPSEDGSVDARHAREYTAREIYRLLEDAGFRVTLLETGPFRHEPHPELHWVEALLRLHDLGLDYRGECIFAVGRKQSSVPARYPDWLYSGGA